jgi:hypothetical protein
MSVPLAATGVVNIARGRSIEYHPFVAKLVAHAPLNREDFKALGRVLKPPLSVNKEKISLFRDMSTRGFTSSSVGSPSATPYCTKADGRS